MWGSGIGSGSDESNLDEFDIISSSAQLDGRECICGNGIVTFGEGELQQFGSPIIKFDGNGGGNITTGSINDCIVPQSQLSIEGHEGIYVNTRGGAADGSSDTGYCHRFGDVNLDHDVNILDIVAVVNRILDPAAEDDPIGDDFRKYKLADTTGDGEVNILDVVNMLNYIVNNEQ